ncbi:MAG: hypothetical protein ABIT01_08010 [Thermoanaerobaculia bacterium]
MSVFRFVIPGRLPGLNEVNAANRSNIYAGASQKKAETKRCALACAALPDFDRPGGIKPPVVVRITWHEADWRRDFDNITSAKKFILDGLVKSRKLENDSRRFVAGGSDILPPPDKKNPRIEVEIEEVCA